jgi:uncharacterized membrane protein
MPFWRNISRGYNAERGEIPKDRPKILHDYVLKALLLNHNLYDCFLRALLLWRNISREYNIERGEIP